VCWAAGAIKLKFRKLNSILWKQRRLTESELTIDIAKISVKVAGLEQRFTVGAKTRDLRAAVG
jgi:hypothetical protein